MPKRVVSSPPEQPASWYAALPPWRAAGLSLAPIAGAAFNGVAALCAAAIAAVLILAFSRLHRHAPRAATTGDLVASTMGASTGRFTGLTQLAAYVLLGVGAAIALALQPLSASPDLETALAGWWWPGWSVAVVVIAGAVVVFLPTRSVGATTAILAGSGLLIFVYIALAILARVAMGTEPMPMGAPPADSLLLVTAAAIPLGLGLAGFEAPTAVSDRLPSLTRPLMVSVGVTALCSALLLWAANAGAAGGFRSTAAALPLVVAQFFGDAGYYWFVAGAVCLGSAAVLGMMWAATRVAARLFGSGPEVAMVVTAVMCLLAVVSCRFQPYLGRLQTMVPTLLLLVVYVLVAEANSRVRGPALAQQVPRLIAAVVLAGVVLIPMRAGDYAVSTLWPPVVTAVILAAAAVATRVGGPARPAPRLR